MGDLSEILPWVRGLVGIAAAGSFMYGMKHHDEFKNEMRPAHQEAHAKRLFWGFVVAATLATVLAASSKLLRP